MLFRDLQNSLFQTTIRNKKYVMYFFTALYTLIICLIFIGEYFIVSKKALTGFWLDIGVGSGRAALVLLCVVVLPGILGRFDLKIPITLIITRYRRQFGILVFLLALAHFLLVKLFFSIEYLGTLIKLLSSFELYGIAALTFLLVLFLTSNEWSVIKLKKWWKRLHRIIYMILWLVFGHVILQKISIWSILIGFIATLEIISLLYSYIKKRSI